MRTITILLAATLLLVTGCASTSGDFQPSKRTIDETKTFIGSRIPGMTSDELYRFVRTEPILITLQSRRCRWILQDGSLWTGFRVDDRGRWILLDAEFESETASTSAGSPDNPRPVTSSDIGPNIDPSRLAASPYNGLPFRTFHSFVSGSYAGPGVWVYAAGDDQELYDTRLQYVFPDFYQPSWGEVFDHVARQMRCAWSWNPQNRQFKFGPATAGPFFSVTLAEGWQREDRGLYVWHAPPDQNFGMDIYYFGHYTPTTNEPELATKVRSHFATTMISSWPDPPAESEMTKVNVGNAEALYLKAPTPRRGGIWRQWSFVTDGHAFLIVNAMPQEREAEMTTAVDAMVASFKIQPLSTAPAH